MDQQEHLAGRDGGDVNVKEDAHVEGGDADKGSSQEEKGGGEKREAQENIHDDEEKIGRMIKLANTVWKGEGERMLICMESGKTPQRMRQASDSGEAVVDRHLSFPDQVVCLQRFYDKYGVVVRRIWEGMNKDSRRELLLTISPFMPRFPGDANAGKEIDGKRGRSEGASRLLPELNVRDLVADAMHKEGEDTTQPPLPPLFRLLEWFLGTAKETDGGWRMHETALADAVTDEMAAACHTLSRNDLIETRRQLILTTFATLVDEIKTSVMGAPEVTGKATKSGEYRVTGGVIGCVRCGAHHWKEERRKPAKGGRGKRGRKKGGGGHVPRTAERKRIKACAGCEQSFYCSVACQRADWPFHKPACEKERRRRAAGVPGGQEEEEEEKKRTASAGSGRGRGGRRGARGAKGRNNNNRVNAQLPELKDTLVDTVTAVSTTPETPETTGMSSAMAAVDLAVRWREMMREPQEEQQEGETGNSKEGDPTSEKKKGEEEGQGKNDVDEENLYAAALQDLPAPAVDRLSLNVSRADAYKAVEEDRTRLRALVGYRDKLFFRVWMNMIEPEVMRKLVADSFNSVLYEESDPPHLRLPRKDMWSLLNVDFMCKSEEYADIFEERRGVPSYISHLLSNELPTLVYFDTGTVGALFDSKHLTPHPQARRKEFVFLLPDRFGETYSVTDRKAKAIVDQWLEKGWVVTADYWCYSLCKQRIVMYALDRLIRAVLTFCKVLRPNTQEFDQATLGPNAPAREPTSQSNAAANANKKGKRKKKGAAAGTTLGSDGGGTSTPTSSSSTSSASSTTSSTTTSSSTTTTSSSPSSTSSSTSSPTTTEETVSKEQ